jgi:hypothetical protein
MSSSTAPTTLKGVKTLMNKLPAKSLIPSRRQTLPVLERPRRESMKTFDTKRRASGMSTSSVSKDKKMPTFTPPKPFESPVPQKNLQTRKRHSNSENSKLPITTKSKGNENSKIQPKDEDIIKTEVKALPLMENRDMVGVCEKSCSTHCEDGLSDTESNSESEYELEAECDLNSDSDSEYDMPLSSCCKKETQCIPPEETKVSMQHSPLSNTTAERRRSSMLEKLNFPILECGQDSPSLTPRQSIAQLEEEITDIEELFSRVQEAVSRGNVRNRILVYSVKK